MVITLKKRQSHKDKKSPRNCHRFEENKEARHLNGMWEPRRRKKHLGKNLGNLKKKKKTVWSSVNSNAQM